MPGVEGSRGAGDGSQKKPCKSGLLKMERMGMSDRGGSLRWAVGVFGELPLPRNQQGMVRPGESAEIRLRGNHY